METLRSVLRFAG